MALVAITEGEPPTMIINKSTDRTKISRRSLLAAGAGATIAAAVPGAAFAEPRTVGDPVQRWIRDQAVSLRTVDPSAPLDDLRLLPRLTRGATLVGLGEHGHNFAEVTTLKHRVLRQLVERQGFRTLFWEEDWSLCLLIDRHLSTGAGDLIALVNQMSPAWRNQQVVDLLRWLRRHNLRQRNDQVRFVGAEHYATLPFVYTELKAYLAKVAPEHRAEVAELIKYLIPDCSKTDDPDCNSIGGYARWYFLKVQDKEPFLTRAARLREIVDALPCRPGDLRRELAGQAARQIQKFYLHYSFPPPEIPSFRDAGAAGTIRWWHDLTRTKAVYWAATSHTSRAARVSITGGYPVTFAPVGSHLAGWYGERYRVIGFGFHHGTYRTETGAVVDVPVPKPDWYEHTFTGLDHDQSVLDLSGRVPNEVREWLAAPFLARGYPDEGYDSEGSGGTLADWFDVIIHRREVAPTDLIRADT
ncbi:erythromycin esterase family protein [Microlunatus parietis]|uniref:Erythromycin esterase n=1 Tax=Microlunatus parietis TaxID=682979 RepID=A0A7Y9ICH6_9ACTN|nr:erythromycin esterase family protein [Microlunatus parietis]NYE74396.1 erythromycin esterase [Microlunatus parietis]